MDDAILQRMTTIARSVQSDLGARRNQALFFCAIGAVIIVLGVSALVLFSGIEMAHPLITVVSCALIPSAILYNILSHSYRKKGQDILTRGLAGVPGVSFSPSGALLLQAAQRHDILPLHRSGNSESGFEGAHRDVAFSFEDVALNGPNLTGILIRIRLPRSLSGHTIIVPHNIRQSLYRTQFGGLGKIELANPKFSRQYTVLGSDPVEARVVLTSQVMEALLETGHFLRARWIAVSLEQNEVVIFAQRNAAPLECGPLWQRPVHAPLQNLLNNFSSVFRLIDVFKLNRQMAA